ncbi:MAG: FtsX-like permease family protein, partial [Hungatella sp.]
NQFTVQEGRLPQKQGECLIDRGKITSGVYQIGDQVQVYSGTDDAWEDTLKTNIYTVVGIGTSSRYLSLERGTTGIGDGSLDCFMVVTPDNFALEAYTDIYLLTEKGESLIAYSEEYDDYIEQITTSIEDHLSEERSRIRYEEVVGEADEKLNDARVELAEKKQEADDKLADAARQIAEADEKIADGHKDVEQGQKDLNQGKADLAQAEVDLADGKKKLDEKVKELEDAKVTLAEKEQELADAKVTLAEKEQELADGKKEVEEKEPKLEDARNKFEEKTEGAISDLEYGWQDYEYGLEEYEQAYDTLKEQKENLKEAKNQHRRDMADANKEASTLQEKEANRLYDQAVEAQFHMQQEQLNAAEQQLKAVKKQLSSAKHKLKLGQEKIDKAQTKIIDGEQELADAKQKIIDGDQKVAEAHRDITDAEIKIAEAHQDIAEGDAKIADAYEEIRDGESKIPKAKADIKKGETDIADARKKLEEGEADLADAKIKYSDSKAEAEQKIADAQKKIDDAQKDINEIEVGEWFVLDRNKIQTYVEYGNDAERIGAIGKVFPFIFFLVAALVSLTTMTRMVEEQRLQIGTLKALGYGKWSIASKYILYAFWATLAGSILGVAVGEKVLPYVIMTAYFILYQNLPVMLMPYHLNYAAMAAGLALGCTVLSTLFASYKELLSSPAALMRPVPPKQGKRVWLESITFLWKRLSFIQKATVRNLFRYKKRCLMTIFGIGGCMALLLVGFGLRDSISTLGEKQYNDIWTYDVQIGLDPDIEPEETQHLMQYLDTQKLKNRLCVKETIMDVTGGGVTKEASIFVPETVSDVEQFLHLRNRLSGETFQIEDHGILITEKLASLLGVKPGDHIDLKEDEGVSHQVLVNGIVENYLQHYIYMSPVLYHEIYGEEAKYNTMFLRFGDTGPREEDSFGAQLLDFEAVASVVFIGTMRGQIEDMLASLDVVIWVLIVSAGLLAFVVLYNLNNININERLRELATIKVLGFYDMELAAYVYRENIMLTILGSAVGAVMGCFLHRYVMLTVEVDMLMFGRQVLPASYLYSILLTCGFSAFVNGMMYFKLKKINMVESLKSVE